METALLSRLGVLLNEKARPTFSVVLCQDEKVREKVETLRSLASSDMSLADIRTSSDSGSGRQRVLAT